MHRWLARFGFALLCVAAAPALAQDVPIYADTTLNDFQDEYSYGGGSVFDNAAPVHSGNASIAFTGNNNFSGNAVSFAHPSGAFASGSYSSLRFFVNGGPTGGQKLKLLLQGNSPDSMPVLPAEVALDPYIAGGVIPSNSWAQVEVPFSALTFNNNGSFDRIDIRTAAAGGVQPVLYLDDVSLVAASLVDLVFTNNFEGAAPPLPGQLRFSSASYGVGEVAGSALITVQRVNGSAGAIGVAYATSNGSAAQPGDYTSGSGTLNWADGDSADKTFMVGIADDLSVEGDETVNLGLSAPGGGASLAAPSSAVLTIADNDVPGPPGMLRFSAAAFAAVENAGPATITVERVNGSAGPVSVQYATSNGSATQPGDYALASGTLNWADGDTAAKTFNVTLVNDGIEEPDETINLTLSIPGGGAMLGPPGSAVLTISDPPQLPFRGTNLVGMEQYYAAYDQVTGPVAGNNYPVFDTRNVDYFAGKGITTLRFLFSWEAMQSQLFGTIPAANAGNYKDYFDNYKRIVDYATNVKGMQVIVEPWQANPDGGAGGPRWRGDLVGSVAVPTTAWSDFWTKMAGIFAANPRVAFGLVNEPNNMSTMGWWAIAQAGVTAIRSSGATQRIYIPGNGYSAASTWTSGNYFNDPDAVKRSNAYGWLHANGGTPIFDPLNNIAAEVHTYLDDAQGGLDDGITSVTAAREHLTPAIDEGRLRGYKIYLGELGMYASNPIAPAAWADFISYFEANADEFAGFTWWAGGDPVFWPDVHAAYFSISPTSNATYTGDTVNMDMIENDF